MSMHALPPSRPARVENLPDSLTGLQQLRKRVVLVSGLLLLVALMFSVSAWPAGGIVHEGSEMLGYAFIFLCIAGRSWCSLYIGGRKKKALVDQGAYSLSRNPLYLFSVLGSAGVGLQTGSLVTGLIFGMFIFAVFSVVILQEEKFLEANFPRAFAVYVARVPRWGPRFSGWHADPELVVQPRLVLLTFRDALVFLAAVPLLEGIEIMQEAGWLPVLLHLP